MDWKSYLENTEIVIHAGGMSERWYPVNQGKTPKVLTEIGKKPRPMIDWTILPYVINGTKKFFITLWHDPEKIIEHCDEITGKTGIKFEYLNEGDKRLGRAGVIKHFLESEVLDKNKPKIMAGGADIVNIDPKKFTEFHLDGVNNGFLATVIGSKTGQSQFDKIIFNPNTGKLIRMDLDRTIILNEGQSANTGTAYFDANANSFFENLSEDRLPIDWENVVGEVGDVRCFPEVNIYENWIPLKTPYDYKKAKDMDLEKWFKINSSEEYLG